MALGRPREALSHPCVRASQPSYGSGTAARSTSHPCVLASHAELWLWDGRAVARATTYSVGAAAGASAAAGGADGGAGAGGGSPPGVWIRRWRSTASLIWR